MRLIRGFLPPAKIGLSRQYQWHQVIKSSNGSIQTVSVETSNPVHGSNMQWLGRSFAASAPSDALETRKPRRRVTIDERKSMVETYVSKYREMNSGKFPTVSTTQKDLGGSYYVIRQLLQELKYKSKISSTDAIALEKDSVKDEISTGFAGEVSQTKELSKKGSRVSTRFRSKERPQSSIAVEESVNDKTKRFSAVNDKSEDVGTQFDYPIYEPKSSLDSDPENSVKHETITEENQQLDRLQPQESTDSELSREMDKAPIEPQRQVSVWQNIKSFANGIFDIWRKS